MDKNDTNPDVVLIGAGIMTATLAMFLKELQPSLNIHIYERLPEVAAESTDAWNNAGTGHSAFCELNYTTWKEDGSIDISKANSIASAFEKSKQYWSYLVKKNYLPDPVNFIHNVPHMSFVWGKDNVEFLRKRYEAMMKNPLFSAMQYTEDPLKLAQWMPLVMENRNNQSELAATRMDYGTDVNFGALTRAMINHLSSSGSATLFLEHEIRDIEKQDNGSWELTVKDIKAKKKRLLYTGFVFIGAGGGALPLLEKSAIPEAAGYGGFPISGQWLRCKNEDVIARHYAKVYGKASVGAPPMSVPHLDTRVINGKKELLFGPYAGFTTKFLKTGSWLDLPLSLEWDNIFPMLSAGWHNLSLIKYLVQQVSQSQEQRMDALKEYFPGANAADWELEIAGQRVQVIKKDKEKGAVIEFGTEIVASADGTLAALLGASPGASTAAAIMLEVLERCFKDQFHTNAWQIKLKEMIPSYGISLSDNPEKCVEMRLQSAHVLGLQF